MSQDATASVRLDVYDPTSVRETVQFHARRLGNLDGTTIGELSNGVWDDHRTFPYIRQLLLERFSGLRVIPFTEFPIGSEQIDSESTIDLLVEKGCQAVITGNAA